MRNKTENRLKHKPTKRDIERSEKDLMDTNERHRFNSYPGEITKKNYIRITNTHIEPDIVAKIIKEELDVRID